MIVLVHQRLSTSSSIIHFEKKYIQNIYKCIFFSCTDEIFSSIFLVQIKFKWRRREKNKKMNIHVYIYIYVCNVYNVSIRLVIMYHKSSGHGG